MAALNTSEYYPTESPMPAKEMAISRQLRNQANLILKLKQNANLLCDIMEMFNTDAKNYTPLLLTVELIFTTMLRRGDMFIDNSAEDLLPDDAPEVIHIKWLRGNFEMAFGRTVACMKRGEESSRIQALVTACKLLKENSAHPLDSVLGRVHFHYGKLRDILDALVDADQAQTALINRFQEYTEYRDVQQYGLRQLASMAKKQAPSQMFIQNYLELFDTLVKPGLPKVAGKDDKYLSELDDPKISSPTECKKFINRCWGHCLRWPLRASESNHRRVLLLLVDRIMPYLSKPVLATDLLCDSLDCGTSVSIIALRGIMELVTKFKIEYPDIYDRLYGMFEPEVFAERSKKRLVHLADVFLSSTRLPETLVAAFAKRFSRLALVASPEDAIDLLHLISNIIQRHPGLKKMLRQDQPAIMPKDPYVMEEARPAASRAIHSSLWEVSALQHHFTPEVSATAAKVLAAADAGTHPPSLPPSTPDNEQFDMECKKRFKTIEMNFVRVSPYYYLNSDDKMHVYWQMAKDEL